MRLLPNKLQDKAGDNGGAGGGGTSLLATSAGGSGVHSTTGGSPAGAGTATGAGAAGDAGSGGSTTGGETGSWRSILPKELQEDANIRTIPDVSTLAKSFVHARNAIGADKLVIPSKHASDDDWKQVYEKLGLPKDVKDYAIKFKEGVSLDKGFIDKFKETAHTSGILPHQAQKLADWFQETNLASEAEVIKMQEAKVANDVKALKTEWGNAYDKKMSQAGQVLREAADPELFKALTEDASIGNNINVLKLLTNVADKFMKEDKSVGGDPTLNGQKSPLEAKKEYELILGNMSHPYYIKEHPGHKTAVAEMQGLFNAAYPETKN